VTILRHWKLVLGLLVVFLAGGVTGSVLTLGVVHKRYRERLNPDTWGPRTVAWLHRELKLTPEQEEQARPIVDEEVGELVRLRDGADKERRVIIGRMLLRIAENLTPEQRDRLQELIEKARSRNPLPRPARDEPENRGGPL
jgi:hypothetical protein